MRRAASLHDTISTSHSRPVQPGAQVHWYVWLICLQVAPLRHGLAAHAAAKARAGGEEDSRSALERVPEVRGVMPEREIERRVTLDVEAYRTAAKRASERAGGASTSGGTIGKVAFDGRSDVGIAGKRRREVGEDVGEKPERIGAAARKKKKKNKKLNARRARQC